LLCLDSLGAHFMAAGDYTGARPHVEEGVRIKKKIRGPRHVETAAALDQLGLVLSLLGSYEAAREAHEQAVAIYKACKEPIRVAASLTSLGGMFFATGNYGAARGCYEQALQIHRENEGEDSPHTAETLGLLAGLLGAQGDFKTARTHLERALAIYEKKNRGSAGDRYALAGYRHALGILSLRTGHYEASRAQLTEAHQATQEIFGTDHPATARSRADLALLDAAAKRWDEAGAGLDQAFRTLRRHGSHMLAGL